MALMPKRVKHRKNHRGSRKGFAMVGNRLSYGAFGLKSTGRAWVKADQIEACRVAVTRHLKRKGKVWIRIFPDKSVSKKPLETRQGKGKGPPEFWVAVVKPGAMIFEIAGVTEQLAREALRLAAAKLPMATMFITR